MNRARNLVLAVASISLLAGMATSATMVGAEDTPPVEETPIVETPVVEETPIVEVLEVAPSVEPIVDTYPLLNTTAGFDECPDGVGLAWHFVAPPKSKTDFLEISLKLKGVWVEIEQDSWLEDPLNGDAYVSVPAGYLLTDLEAGEFVVEGPVDEKGVRLSHTCEGDDPEPTTPTIIVTKTAVHDQSADYDWSVEKSVERYVANDDGTVDVEYEIIVTKGPLGDQTASVSGTITIENAGTVDVVLTDLQDDITTLTGEVCTIEDFSDDVSLPAPEDEPVSVSYDYTCEVAYGLTGTGTNKATATYTWVDTETRTGTGTGEKTFEYVEGTITDETTTLTDDYGTPEDDTDDPKPAEWLNISETTTFTYTRPAVTPGGSACDPGFVNTAEVTDPTLDGGPDGVIDEENDPTPDDGTDNSDDAIAELCTNTDGYTIGFWGNNNGWAFLGTNNFLGNALADYSAVRTWDPNGPNQAPKAPGQWSTQRDARNYFQAANCSGTCRFMLGAQFLATAFNVERTESLGDTKVLIPTSLQTLVGGSCVSIEDVLAAANTYFPNVAGSNLATTTALKSLFDRINNNSAVTCTIED